MELHEAGSRLQSHIVSMAISQVKERSSRRPQDRFVCMYVVVPILLIASRLWVGVLIPDPMPNPLSICSVPAENIGPAWDAHDTVLVLPGSLPRCEVRGYILRVREVVVGVSLCVFSVTHKTL